MVSGICLMHYVHNQILNGPGPNTLKAQSGPLLILFDFFYAFPQLFRNLTFLVSEAYRRKPSLSFSSSTQSLSCTVSHFPFFCTMKLYRWTLDQCAVPLWYLLTQLPRSVESVSSMAVRFGLIVAPGQVEPTGWRISVGLGFLFWFHRISSFSWYCSSALDSLYGQLNWWFPTDYHFFSFSYRQNQSVWFLSRAWASITWLLLSGLLEKACCVSDESNYSVNTSNLLR